MTDPSYRCLYCDETFITHRSADAHFHFEHYGEYLERNEPVIEPISDEVLAE